MNNRYFLLIIFLILKFVPVQASDTIPLNKKKLIIVTTGTLSFYAGGLYLLNETWYKNNPRTSFHFFNDEHEWKQMDKAGHLTTAFHQGRISAEILMLTGLSKKKSYLYGGLASVIFQTPIEILDGYSAKYGFSWSDIIANTGGTLLFTGQYLAWEEIRITPKFSFSRSAYAKERPNVLGKNLPEQVLKDYNGQTYWLSFNIHSFLRKDSNFPKWLNFSLGYGATGMIYAADEANRAIGLDPYRKYFLAMDIDFTKVKTKSRFLNFVFHNVVNIVHVPGPTLEYNKYGFKGYLFYF
ncbi:MAG: DUF2279 domain-containing protein [Cytophagaceae bacterium]